MQQSRYHLFLTCPKYISPYLSQELEELGYSERREVVSGVELEGSMHDVMRLNLLLRCAHRVLVRVADFFAYDPDDLYRKALKVDWEEWIEADGYVSVISSVDHPTITNTQFAQLKLKDAIADRIRQKFGRRPDSGPRNDRTVVYLYWHGENCSIYIDSSGVPISRRGYRVMSATAPLNEILAAAMIRATRWDRQMPFINPMCGSGTLSIEAALLASGTPSQMLRDNFGFMHIRPFNKAEWTALREVEMSKRNKAWKGSIVASDRNSSAVMATRRNAQTAEVMDFIDVRMLDFRKTPIEEGPGVVILNPEYGERMGGNEELNAVYASIGDWFKERCGAKHGYVFSANMEALKSIGLKASRRIPFFNADLECRLVEFELYSGSRKQRSSEGESNGVA